MLSAPPGRAVPGPAAPPTRAGHRRARAFLALGLAGAAVTAAVPVTLAATGPSPAYTVVAKGLNNPRQVTWAADGRTLLVAEAGRGGTADCGPAVGPFFPVCAGMSGSVTAISNPAGSTTRRRVVTGLASQAEEATGLGAAGPTGVAVFHGRVVAAIGQFWADTPTVRGSGGTVLEAGAQGRAVRAGVGATRDLGQLAVAGGRLFAADAASGVLWRITGATAQAAVRFDPAVESVDALATGPDRRVYVATSRTVAATGGGYDLRWQVWRIDPVSGARTAVRTGPGALTGLAFGPDGSMWAAGRVARTAAGFVTGYHPDGRVSSYVVPDPGGIAVGRDGRIYVAAYSSHDWDGDGPTSNSGRVLRLRPGTGTPGVGAAAAARPLLPTAPPSAAEGYSPQLPQVSCDPVAKPGVRAFRSLVLATYGRGWDGGIIRPCSTGGASHHKEGRAWDWMLDLARFEDRRAGAQLIRWLMADDALNARRLGVNTVIWQRRVWYSFHPEQSWQPYTGPHPHDDHIHLSFSWAGAMKRTSGWSGQVAAEEYGPCPPAPGQLAPPYGTAINLTPCPIPPTPAESPVQAMAPTTAE